MRPFHLPPGLDLRGLLRPVGHVEHEARERDMGFRRTIRKQVLLPAERTQFLGRPRCDQFVGSRRMPHPSVQTEKPFVGGDGLWSPATLEPGGLQGGGRLRLERPAKESMQGCTVRHEVVGDQVRAHPASEGEERDGHFHDFFIRTSNGASASLLRKGHIQLTQIPPWVQQEAPPRTLGRGALTEGPEEWPMREVELLGDLSVHHLYVTYMY